jgi:hypothetical protein
MNDAYAAGLFDGEGYIRIVRWEKPDSMHIRWQVFGGIGVTHRPVIEALQQAYGGSINMNRHDLRNPQHRIQFTWSFASQTAASFLQSILPHLIIKREQAELALELQASINQFKHKLGFRGGNLHPQHAEIRAHREDLYRRITAAKHVRYAPLLRNGPKSR